MTSKNTGSQGRQCHARHRSGLKGREKGREARGNDVVRGREVGAYVRRCNQYERADVLTSFSTETLKAFAYPVKKKTRDYYCAFQ